MTHEALSANLQLLRVLQLASPALPIGAFHFSQGLEFALEQGWVRDESTARTWIAGIGQASIATLDLPVAARMHAAWTRRDYATVRRWNNFLAAARETRELRAEDRHLGQALRRILRELGIASAAIDGVQWTHAAMFTSACAAWDIEAGPALTTYAWAWLENQVLAAVKLIPLGQTAGQRVLNDLLIQVPGWVSRAFDVPDEEIGIATVRHALASAGHERQYTRLFKS
jgi:urease accessory protein